MDEWESTEKWRLDSSSSVTQHFTIFIVVERMMNIDTQKDVYHRLPSTKLFLQTVTHHFYRLWHTSSASYIAPHNFHREWHKTPNKECVNVCMCPCSWVSLIFFQKIQNLIKSMVLIICFGWADLLFVLIKPAFLSKMSLN